MADCGGCCGKTDGQLPAGGLDAVAAQFKREFAAQAGGGAQDAAEAPEAPQVQKVLVRKKISQETFDDVVQENRDEFDMDLAEAMRDAVEQFTSQGVDLSMIVTTPEAKLVDEAMKLRLDSLNAMFEDPLATGTGVAETLKEIKLAIMESEDARIAAGRHGCVGATTFVCKKFQSEREAVLAALDTLKSLLTVPENREVMPFQGGAAIVECLTCYNADEEVQAKGFAALAVAITKHEANKRNIKDVDINSRIIETLKTHGTQEAAILAVSKFVRIYLSDDDRRPGVQPGTFSRARELGEDYRTGILAPLLAILGQEQTLAKESLVVATLSALKSVAVNDTICKNIANNGGLEVILVAFEAHITDEKVASNACMVLKAITRNDDLKRTVGKGTGLGLLLQALDEHMDSVRVTEQALQCLSVLCLRQPLNCETIAGLGCLQLITTAMQKHPDAATVQRPAISTMRNMVSSWQNKELQSKILDHNAEELICKAREAHPICEEVAYAALRDLGCDYQAPPM